MSIRSAMKNLSGILKSEGGKKFLYKILDFNFKQFEEEIDTNKPIKIKELKPVLIKSKEYSLK